ncbi:MAG: hypothetical protein IBX50_08530 [Marinospirillum sp.]|uniref:hypothetical protein n=1 Tax=Marinospirillum sp. TaxID=2183934 RepID=UPI001A099CC0|nr:hypothetical protein [Marinospirillum sp.]MBE0506752.1 hypothetical protein [Marinospirillum sp.]
MGQEKDIKTPATTESKTQGMDFDACEGFQEAATQEVIAEPGNHQEQGADLDLTLLKIDLADYGLPMTAAQLQQFVVQLEAAAKAGGKFARSLEKSGATEEVLRTEISQKMQEGSALQERISEQASGPSLVELNRQYADLTKDITTLNRQLDKIIEKRSDLISEFVEPFNQARKLIASMPELDADAAC